MFLIMPKSYLLKPILLSLAAENLAMIFPVKNWPLRTEKVLNSVKEWLNNFEALPSLNKCQQHLFRKLQHRHLDS